jgi:hypothetical protein
MSTLLWFDPGVEDVFTLKRGHKLIDRHYRTLRRYAIYGCRDVNGCMVQLEVCKLPGGVGTTVEAYRRFISRLNNVAAAS